MNFSKKSTCSNENTKTEIWSFHMRENDLLKISFSSDLAIPVRMMQESDRSRVWFRLPRITPH